MEGAPLSLDDMKVAGLREPVGELAPFRRQAARRPRRGFVDRLAERVGLVGGEGDPHENDERARRPEAPRQIGAALEDLNAAVRRQVSREGLPFGDRPERERKSRDRG